MINGVNFQPGSMEQERNRRMGASGSADGVQEAIKVLSLRLPKVVGARAVSPSALLQGQGGQGNPQIDSMVERVLAKMFPGQGGQQPNAPVLPTQSPGTSHGYGPQFGGNVQGGGQPQREQTADTTGPQFRAPRVTAGNPPPEAPLTGGPNPQWPNLPGVDGGGGFPAATIAPLPDLRRYLDGLVPGPSVREEPPLI